MGHERSETFLGIRERRTECIPQELVVISAAVVLNKRTLSCQRIFTDYLIILHQNLFSSFLFQFQENF